MGQVDCVRMCKIRCINMASIWCSGQMIKTQQIHMYLTLTLMNGVVRTYST